MLLTDHGEEIEMNGYHYTECGLDNIYLLNGFQMIDSTDGEGVYIEDIHDLHTAIAESIISKGGILLGQEIRFLRHMLDLSQGLLAKMLGVDYQSVARWEKSETQIRKTADYFLRTLLHSYLKPQQNESIYEMINDLSNLDSQDIENKQIKFIFDEKLPDWKVAV